MVPRSDATLNAKKRQQVVLLNVKFSPNLGDGLLSECLEMELSERLPGSIVRSVDLAGRVDYSRSSDSARGLMMAALETLPNRIRALASGLLLELLLTFKLRRHYRTQMRAASVVVVGGGNLLSDTDLNFPMKIASALRQAKAFHLPVAVYGVGVLRNWSRRGAKLFGRGLTSQDVFYASVRDYQSSDAWIQQLASYRITDPIIVTDPGVLASLHYPRGERSLSGRKVGFCITNPLAVRYHSKEAYAANLNEWYVAALRSLVQSDFEVALFTNGSPEDRTYLHEHYRDWIRIAKGPVILVDSFDNPSDLTSFVSSCEAVIGHRMHACIAAFSYGVPALGLKWDVKLDSFFDSAGRSAYIVDPSVDAAGEVGSRMQSAIDDSFDPKPLIARSQVELAAFARSIKEQLGVMHCD